MSYHQGFLYSTALNRMEPQWDSVIVRVRETTFYNTQNPSALETIGCTHRHLQSHSVFGSFCRVCSNLAVLISDGLELIYTDRSHLQFKLTPVPLCAISHAQVRPSASQMTGKQRPTWQVWPDTCEIRKVGRKGEGEGGITKLKDQM